MISDRQKHCAEARIAKDADKFLFRLRDDARRIVQNEPELVAYKAGNEFSGEYFERQHDGLCAGQVMGIEDIDDGIQNPKRLKQFFEDLQWVRDTYNFIDICDIRKDGRTWLGEWGGE